MVDSQSFVIDNPNMTDIIVANIRTVTPKFIGLPVNYNTMLSGKKLLAKIVNGVKQPTVFSV